MQIVSIPELQWRASLLCPLYIELPDGLPPRERKFFWAYVYREIYNLSKAMGYLHTDMKDFGRMTEVFENHYDGAVCI